MDGNGKRTYSRRAATNTASGFFCRRNRHELCVTGGAGSGASAPVGGCESNDTSSLNARTKQPRGKQKPRRQGRRSTAKNTHKKHTRETQGKAKPTHTHTALHPGVGSVQDGAACEDMLRANVVLWRQTTELGSGFTGTQTLGDLLGLSRHRQRRRGCSCWSCSFVGPSRRLRRGWQGPSSLTRRRWGTRTQTCAWRRDRRRWKRAT